MDVIEAKKKKKKRIEGSGVVVDIVLVYRLNSQLA
jgi:hypothetical protein